MKKPDKKKLVPKKTTSKQTTKKRLVKKPTKKPLKKNPNSVKIFNILARKVFQISKNRNLGWKWSDAQKWTSKNLFSKYKMYSVIPVSKWAKINEEIASILDKKTEETPFPAQYPAQEYCFNALKIPTESLEPINWWELADAISYFDNNLKVSVEFDGVLNTGIIKKGDLPNMIEIRELLRAAKHGSDYFVVFRILVAPDKQDDGGDCSYYILITTEGSAQDIDTRNSEVDVFTSKQSLPLKTKQEAEEAQKRMKEELKRKRDEAKQRSTKKEAKARERPQQVEPKTEGKVGVDSEKYNALTKALEILRMDVKEGLITKKQYQKRQQQLLDKFEKGGEI